MKKTKFYENKISKLGIKIDKLNKKWNKLFDEYQNYETFDFKVYKIGYLLDKISVKTQYYNNLIKHYWNCIYKIKEFKL